jgi:hypothetical protein
MKPKVPELEFVSFLDAIVPANRMASNDVGGLVRIVSSCLQYSRVEVCTVWYEWDEDTERVDLGKMEADGEWRWRRRGR